MRRRPGRPGGHARRREPEPLVRAPRRRAATAARVLTARRHQRRQPPHQVGGRLRARWRCAARPRGGVDGRACAEPVQPQPALAGHRGEGADEADSRAAVPGHHLGDEPPDHAGERPRRRPGRQRSGPEPDPHRTVPVGPDRPARDGQGLPKSGRRARTVAPRAARRAPSGPARATGPGGGGRRGRSAAAARERRDEGGTGREAGGRVLRHRPGQHGVDGGRQVGPERALAARRRRGEVRGHDRELAGPGKRDLAR